MENRGLTNGDKMLQIVLNDQGLITSYDYNPNDYETLDEALNSENAVVVSIAKLIQGVQRNYTSKEIYNEVTNYLKNNLL